MSEIAEFYEEIGDDEQSLYWYRTASKFSDDPYSYIKIASLLEDNEDYDESAYYFKLAHDVAPNDQALFKLYEEARTKKRAREKYKQNSL